MLIFAPHPFKCCNLHDQKHFSLIMSERSDFIVRFYRFMSKEISFNINIIIIILLLLLSSSLLLILISVILSCSYIRFEPKKYITNLFLFKETLFTLIFQLLPCVSVKFNLSAKL